MESTKFPLLNRRSRHAIEIVVDRMVDSAKSHDRELPIASNRRLAIGKGVINVTEPQEAVDGTTLEGRQTQPASGLRQMWSQF